MVHLACALPNLDLRDRQPLSRPGRRHHHRAVGVSRTASFELPTGPGLGVELDRDKLDFYHRYFFESSTRSTSSTTRVGRVGSRHCPSSDDRIAGDRLRSGSPRSTCSTTRRATAGANVVRWSRRSSASSRRTCWRSRRSTGSIDQDHALAAAVAEARLPGLPGVGDDPDRAIRATGTASSSWCDERSALCCSTRRSV